MSDGKVVIECTLNTKSFDAQIKEAENKLNDLEATLEMGREDKTLFSTREMQEMGAEAEKLKNKLVTLNTQKSKLEKADLSNVESQMKNVDKSANGLGNSLNKLIKKVGKWALAVFGVRSAYMAVRKAASTLSQYNEQIKTDLEYFNYAFAKALEPVINGIINLAYKLLGVINSIVQSVFGINLFANASAEDFKKANSSANQLKKTLSGFDEMNVISDSSSSSTTTSPSQNLDLKFSAEGLDKFLDGIQDAFTKTFDKIKEKAKSVFLNVGFSEELISYWELMLEGVKDIFSGALDVILGLVQMFLGLISGDTQAFTDGVQRIWEGLKNIAIGLIKQTIGYIGTAINSLISIVQTVFNAISTKIKEIFNGIVSFIKEKINSIGGLFGQMGSKVGEIVGGAFKSAINAALWTAENILNAPIRAINGLISVINKVPGVNLGKLSTFSLPRLAVGGVINQPGRGVNYGGANIGERGAEGVIPLTNSQMMAELGEAIGKYITINANITNTMNGRVISRELQKINSSSDFAYNR